MNSDLQTAGAQFDVPANAAAAQDDQQASKARYVAPSLVSMGSANRDTAAGGANAADGASSS